MRLVYSILLLVGCDNVDITERVIFTDNTPVVEAKVHQWTDAGYDGYTYTDEKGTWTLTVPSDTVIYLCIENPREGNTEVCYENGYLITPTVESGETNMIKVDK